MEIPPADCSSSSSQSFRLHGHNFGGCRAPGLTHLGATHQYSPEFLAVPPACSKDDVAAAVTSTVLPTTPCSTQPLELWQV